LSSEEERFFVSMRQYAYHIRFKKINLMRYISHLDLLRLFQRAARRAELPLSLTEGFNPHPKIKIEPALKLGLESTNLKAEIRLNEQLLVDEIRERLHNQLPNGIEIIEVKQLIN
jgi:radical SAM-linked protein